MAARCVESGRGQISKDFGHMLRLPSEAEKAKVGGRVDLAI
jgi:hypothetical protein